MHGQLEMGAERDWDGGPCDILMQVSAPTTMGKLWAINCNELVEVTKLFADRKM